MQKFDRNEHVYSSPDFDEIIKDTIRFFNGTPVYNLPLQVKFHGTGVYAIYSIAKKGVYKKFHEINRTSFDMPIYIGKAVPRGWRQARVKSLSDAATHELYGRLSEHAKSIAIGDGIDVYDYHCRFMILEDRESTLIGTVEAALIQKYRPIWNSLIDGFGNHDPGKGRYEQAKSDWDVCHPGRKWAEKCNGVHGDRTSLLASIDKFMNSYSKEKS
jgi:hypothetical protein